MRQRVMIAMALAAEPEVVIMDEPTTALDVVVQKEILAQVVELQNRLRFAVLFITHDLSLLLEIADRIAVMYAGRIVEIGSAEKIHNEPSHPYTQGLLRSFPSVRGARRELAGISGAPPDLRALPPGCPFVPRCRYAGERCCAIDMSLGRVTDVDASHLTACPFVRPARPVTRRRHARQTSRRWREPGGSDEPAPPTRCGYCPRRLSAGRGARGARAREGYRLSHGRRARFFPQFAASPSSSIAARWWPSWARAAQASRRWRGCSPARAADRRRDPARGCRRAALEARSVPGYKSDVQMVSQDPFASLNAVHTVRYALSRPVHCTST